MRYYLIIAALSLGCAYPVTAAQAESSIQAAIWAPPGHQVSRYLHAYWADRVAEQSGGALTVKTDLGSSRITPRGAMAELADGIVDVTTHVAQYTPTELALSNALEEIGMTFSDPRVMIAASTDFSLNNPGMQEEWARNRIVFGGGYVTGLYKLVCNEPIISLADMEGAKLRLPGRAPAAWANSTGAVTVALNANEQYGALDKGALTCTTTTVADVYNRKLYEVAAHITELPITLFWAGFGWAYNADTWGDLTAEQRKALFDAQADASAAYVVRGIHDEEAEARTKLEEAGVTFHKPAEDLSASINNFRKNQPDAAVKVAEEAFGIADPAVVLSAFQGTVDKWDNLLNAVPIEDEEGYANLLRTEIFDKVDVDNYPAN